jgi:hypothetical protein
MEAIKEYNNKLYKITAELVNKDQDKSDHLVRYTVFDMTLNKNYMHGAYKGEYGFYFEPEEVNFKPSKEDILTKAFLSVDCWDMAELLLGIRIG